MVRCRVETREAFSAHADRRGLLEYLQFNPPEKLRHIFLVHGEEDQAVPLFNGLRSKGSPAVYFPGPGDNYSI